MWSGRNKLVINHLGRLFVTSDAATIIRELEVIHPAAKLLVLASQAQESEASSVLHSPSRRSIDVFWLVLDGRRVESGSHLRRGTSEASREYIDHGATPERGYPGI